jgi:hypothetical protein
MRKRKGIKVEVPGVENVSQIQIQTCHAIWEVLTNPTSTTTSYKRTAPRYLPIESSTVRRWACMLTRLLAKFQVACLSPMDQVCIPLERTKGYWSIDEPTRQKQKKTIAGQQKFFQGYFGGHNSRGISA